jgi:hypothetical protein
MNRTISLEIVDEEIVFADLTSRERLELVVVCKSGNIFLCDLEKHEKHFWGNLPFDSVPNLLNDSNPMEILRDLSPEELAKLLENVPDEIESIEDLSAKNKDFVDSLSLNARLYSFKNYVCIVQNKGSSGVVLNLSNPKFQKRLVRGDYHVGNWSFSIAFYEKDNQTFLIHATDWNRLDISCLETDELLTDRIVDYETESNYFDYFHSSLLVSPDRKYFTSNGWHWHPYGQIYCFSIENFLQKFELSGIRVDVSDEDYYDLDWDRPLCWINNKTLAIGFNQQICDEKQKKFPTEVLFFDIAENKIVSRINFDGFSLSSEGEVNGELFYNPENQRLIGLNKKSGVLITDIDGKEIYTNSNLVSYKYSPKHRLFYQIDLKNQEISLVESET